MVWSYVTPTRAPSCRQYCRVVKAGDPSEEFDSESIRPAEASQNRMRPGEQGHTHHMLILPVVHTYILGTLPFSPAVAN